jgi:hypothetical protein
MISLELMSVNLPVNIGIVFIIAFIWFCIIGALGIVSLFVELGKKRLNFKKEYLLYLIVPVAFSVILIINGPGFFEFIKYIQMSETDKLNYKYDIDFYLFNLIIYAFLVFGFPVWIIISLQERLEINRMTVLITSVLTPIATWFSVYAIMIRYYE